MAEASLKHADLRPHLSGFLTEKSLEEKAWPRTIYRGRHAWSKLRMTKWASGGTGRRAGFRFQWGNPSEFESLLAQDKPPYGGLCGASRPLKVLRAPRIRTPRRETAGPPRACRSCVAIIEVCGSSSVVEHRLAKARVASSNLVFRSSFSRLGPAGVGAFRFITPNTALPTHSISESRPDLPRP